jgi:putative flippase GtrA
MVRTAKVDIREFARFVLTGAAATLGNLATVWLTRYFVPFEISLLAGIVAGLSISFMLSKMFAFGSRSWNRSGAEATRFLAVYTLSSAVYLGVAELSQRLALLHGVAAEMAEFGGVLVGAGTMMLTSYFGHRFFTFRTYQRAAERLSGTS